MRTLVVVCPAFTEMAGDDPRALVAFEPVVACIEALAARIEVVSPGVCAVPTVGPSKYFGGDVALARHVTMLVEETLQELPIRPGAVTGEVLVGIADGVFAARLAAACRQIVEPGRTRDFLYNQPIGALEQPNLVDLLSRLGIRTLGDFAELPRADVVGRFGDVGEIAHKLACGEEVIEFQPRVHPRNLSVVEEFEHPIENMDMARFAMKSLADRLHGDLGSHGLACNRLVIEVEMTNAEVLSRVWRHDGRLSASAIADRLRWQLESCLRKTPHPSVAHPSVNGVPTGIRKLSLEPIGLQPDNGQQLGFWGGDIDANDKASRALVRVQGLVGEEGVVSAVLAGGRSYNERIELVPWGSEKIATRTREFPWPGALPRPHPATVYNKPIGIEVQDSDGQSVGVDARGVISAAPAALVLSNVRHLVASWSGPWLVDQSWWDRARARRCARLQLITEASVAYLVVLETGQWRLEAKYD